MEIIEEDILNGVSEWSCKRVGLFGGSCSVSWQGVEYVVATRAEKSWYLLAKHRAANCLSKTIRPYLATNGESLVQIFLTNFCPSRIIRQKGKTNNNRKCKEWNLGKSRLTWVWLKIIQRSGPEAENGSCQNGEEENLVLGVMPGVGAPGRPNPHRWRRRLPVGVSTETVTVTRSESPCFPTLPSFIWCILDSFFL